MHEVESQLTTNHLAIDLNNGNRSTSWPMCMMSFVAAHINVTTGSNSTAPDCSYVDTLLRFIAWSQLNHHAVDKVTQWGFTPLSFGFKTCVAILSLSCARALSLISSLSCARVRMCAGD
jgi:hypothetical protein